MARANLIRLSAAAFREDPSLSAAEAITMEQLERSASGSARALAIELRRRGEASLVPLLSALASDILSASAEQDPRPVVTLPPKLRGVMPTTLRTRIPSTRPALRALVEGAREEVLFIAPYTEPTVARDLAPWISVALEHGARVRFFLERTDDFDHSPFFRNITKMTPRELRSRLEFNVTTKEPGRISHAKLVVVDGARCYVGSGNLTHYAYSQNFEAGIILAGLAASDLYDAVQWYLKSIGVERWTPETEWG